MVVIAPGPDSIGTPSGTIAIEAASAGGTSSASGSVSSFFLPWYSRMRCSSSISVRSAFAKKITPPMIWKAGTVIPKNLNT